MQRGRQRWTREARLPSCAIDHRDRELWLDANVVRGADFAEELQRLDVTAEQHVLAVVDELSGVAIGERGRATAEPASRLEDQHARTVPGQPRRRAESRTTG